MRTREGLSLCLSSFFFGGTKWNQKKQRVAKARPNFCRKFLDCSCDVNWVTPKKIKKTCRKLQVLMRVYRLKEIFFPTFNPLFLARTPHMWKSILAPTFPSQSSSPGATSTRSNPMISFPLSANLLSK